MIARGEYLANSVGRCFWCHSPQDGSDPSSPRPEMLGAGDVLDEHAPIIAPNLTPDPDTGLGLWTDQQIVRAIREGVGRDGQRLRGDHPAAYYSVISDADVVAIVAYLRSLKPIVNKLPRSARQAMYSETVQPFVKPAASTDFKSERARGAYLAHIGECVGVIRRPRPPGHQTVRCCSAVGADSSTPERVTGMKSLQIRHSAGLPSRNS